MRIHRQVVNLSKKERGKILSQVRIRRAGADAGITTRFGRAATRRPPAVLLKRAGQVIKAVAAAAVATAGLPPALILLVTAAGAAPAVPVSGTGAALGGAPARTVRTVIPPGYLALYMAAAPTCPGLPWPVLAGIGTVESDNGQSALPGVHSGSNYAGAEGPMQFLRATFTEYAVDADPGQPVSPYDPADAIYTAAAMLCAAGARSGTPAGIDQAVFAYNHADWYVDEVMSWAGRYAAQLGSAVVVTRPALAARP
jgi:hypothetical protein